MVQPSPAVQPSPVVRPAPVRLRRGVAVALTLGAFLGMIDATVVSVALDPLSRHFRVPLAAAQSVLALYLVTVTASLPTLGRMGDAFGRRRAYLAGFVVFAAGSVIAALAPDFAVLLVGRAVQAAGGGLLTAGSLSLIAVHAPRRTAGRSVSLMVAAQAVAGLLGPPLGGLLVLTGGWQAVFWAGVPAAAAGVVAVIALVPATPERRVPSIDAPGAAGLAMLLLGVGAGVGALGGPGLGGAPAWAWFAVAAVGAAILAAVEPAAVHPLLDPRLLRHPRFARAATATFLSTGTLMSCFALLPFWLEDAHHLSALAAGLCFLPIGAGVALFSKTGGRLADSGLTRRTTAGGMAVAAAGLATAAAAAHAGLSPVLLVALLALGCGNGLFSAPNTAAAMASAPRAALGSAAGLLSAARNAGVITGLGITGAVYTALSRSAGTAGADRAAAAVFAGAAAVCLGVALLAARTYRPSAAAAAGDVPDTTPVTAADPAVTG